MKTYLNPDMVTIATKGVLSKDEIKNISEFLDIKESKIALVVAGRSKAKPEVIDVIMSRIKKQFDLNKLKLEA